MRYAVLLLLLSGCFHDDLRDQLRADSEPACVRECMQVRNSCVSAYRGTIGVLQCRDQEHECLYSCPRRPQ
jgi:hypothetical protein